MIHECRCEALETEARRSFSQVRPTQAYRQSVEEAEREKPRRARGSDDVAGIHEYSGLKMAEFTHFNESGRARMVDVSAKNSTERTATAQATVLLQPETLEKIQRGKIAKGDVLSVAQIAGVMGAKKTPDLIPMCHPILLTSVDISFKEESQPDREGRCSITITATAKTTGPTGVEMEAMTAASVAALTIYDMCKAVDRGMSFSEVSLLSKSGGKSGTFTRR